MAKKKVTKKKTGRSRGGPKTPEGKKKALTNLSKPWHKGVSGNAKGRPKGSSMSAIMTIMCESHPSHMPAVMKIAKDRGIKITAKSTVGEILNEVIMQGAMAGDPRKLEMLLERVEGKVTQKIKQNMTGELDLGGSTSIDSLKLPLKTRKEVLKAMKEAEKEQE